MKSIMSLSTIKRYIGFFKYLSILLMFLPVSCVSDNEFTYINDQIIALNNRVQKLQESIDQTIETGIDESVSKKVDPRIQTIVTNQANATADIDQLRSDLKELEGRVEENDNYIHTKGDQDLAEQDRIKAKLNEIDDIVARLEKLEIAVEQQDRYMGLEDTAKEGADQEGTQAEPQEASVVKESKPTETDMYENSLALYKAGNYEQAIEGFKNFLSEFPKSELADNAQFWIGESYMALKKYDDAALAYNEVRKNYPEGNKVPSAMYRMAIAFLELSDEKTGEIDKKSAKILLNEIIKKYPDLNEAELARKKLEQIK